MDSGQRDLGMGLMDYHARFYSPGINQFTQPDSIISSPANPQRWYFVVTPRDQINRDIQTIGYAMDKVATTKIIRALQAKPLTPDEKNRDDRCY